MLQDRAPTRPPRDVEVRFRVTTREDWTLDETPVPESRAHDLTVELIRALLVHWTRGTRPTAQVGSNLALRWDEAHPRVGVDPDVYLLDPAPPEGDEVTSLRLWQPGHHAPLLAVEVVSPGHPTKDYAQAPEKYATSGVGELWVFDPQLAGPALHGGPHRLQVWTRSGGGWARVHAGDGPALSPMLGAWLVPTSGGARLRIAEDPTGARLWPTAEEAERAAKDAERAAKDAERAAKDAAIRERDAALARIAELEAALAGRR